jgi:YggT family protein
MEGFVGAAASYVKLFGPCMMDRARVHVDRTTGRTRRTMQAVFWLINELLNLYWWVIIIGAVLSWLVAFEVINTRNRFVAMALDFTYRLTEPALRPIRRILPDLGGIDISPVLLLLGIMFLQKLLYDLARMMLI